ncbi:aldo/keto reductase [Pleurocapsales cyanobacterium LEGE 10410]|nr:aldo/keto reductase [Pleurocapsales cyanobacterium LEGE 10410]
MSTIKKLVLPQMGCGTWAWGNRILWGYDKSMDAQLQEVFNLCVSNGVTLFDTGDSYGTGKLNGRSEQLLGKFDREYTGVNKDKICLATKLAAYPWRLTPKSMVKAGLASAQRMGRVDLAQMHWSTANYFPWQEEQLLDGLGDLYEQGLVKGIGLSNYGTKRLKRIHAKFSRRSIPIATLQVQYSLLSTYPVTELGIKETCDELGIKLIAYSPLCLGILTGKYTDSSTYPKGLRNLLFRRLVPEAQPVLNCLQAIAQYRNKTMAQVAINWCIAKGAIPIPGAKNVKQAQENIAVKDWQLDAGEVAELDCAAAGVDKPMIQNVFQTR